MSTWRGAEKIVALAAVGTALIACHEGEVLATLVETSGLVTFKANEQETPEAAVAPLELYEGNVLSTGPESGARVVFAPGQELELDPETTLLIRKDGSLVASFGAILLSGDVVVRSKAGGARWTLGTPFGLVNLGGATDTDVRVTSESGLLVNVGEVELFVKDQKQTVNAGQRFDIAGFVVPIVEQKKQVFELPPMTVTLFADPKKVQVKRAGTDEFVKATARDVLGEGDTVRTGSAASTKVGVGESSDLVLRKNTELVLEKVRAVEGEEMVDVGLRGGAIVHMQTSSNTTRTNTISVAGHSVRIRPGRREADVEVIELGDGRARIVSRAGMVRIDDATDVGPGEVAEIGGTGTEPTVSKLASAVELSPRTNAVVQYDAQIPSFAFTWKGAGGGAPFAFELATDREFEKIVYAEDVPGDTLVFDRMSAGRYFWRVKLGEEWARGIVVVERGDKGLSKVKRNNVVDDTGESTVVYFQRTLPAITLRWKTRDGAASYRAKVFREDNFDAPIVNENTSETQVALSPGRLAEGRYLWLVSGLDAAGKDMSPGKMNNLQIAYDNAVVDLVISSPRGSKEKVKGKKLVTYGEARIGAKLSINGKRVDLDSKGRFRESLTLDRGDNLIVYRTTGQDGIERYHLRDVVAR